MIDRTIDQTVSELLSEINRQTVLQQADLAAAGGSRVKRMLRRTGLTFAELPRSVRDILNSLETTIVAGGTYMDRLFHHSQKLRDNVAGEVRQALLNGEDFDSVRERLQKVFGVDRLATPTSHAYGSVKHYKNEARRQWNLLMKQHAKQSGGKQVWFATLDEDTTPGCAARHGMDLEEMDDPDLPRHPNCRCQVAVVPPGADLSEYRAEGMAWLQANGWTRKEAMLEESGRLAIAVRPLRETWEAWPVLRTLTAREDCKVAVVDAAQADQLKMGQDPGVCWLEPFREGLRRGLRETWLPEPIVALKGCMPASPGQGEGLLSLIEPRTGRVLFEARAEDSAGYRRAAVLVRATPPSADDGKVWAVKTSGYPVWTMPGGHVEDGESPEAAAVREFGEETGFRVELTRYFGELTLRLHTGEVAETMIYEGRVVGAAPLGQAGSPGEIVDKARVAVEDLDEQERDWIRSLPGSRSPAKESAQPEPSIEWSAADSPLVIAGPHGAGDRPTAPIVKELSRRLGASRVIAYVGGDGPRINVNRPTEGVGEDGEDASAEAWSGRAAAVYRRWVAAVWAAAGNKAPRLYVEIHDNDFPATQDALEVATVGVGAAQARALRHKWEALDTSVAMRIAPVDRLEWNGVVAKRIGVFAKTPLALQVELPLKFASQAGRGEHGAIEALEDWLKDVAGVLIEGGRATS